MSTVHQCIPIICFLRLLFIVSDHAYQTNSNGDIALDSARASSAIPAASNPLPEAHSVIKSVVWSAAVTVKAIQDYFPRLVITRTTPRHVEFEDPASCEASESRKDVVFGESTRIDPSYTESASASNCVKTVTETPGTAKPTSVSVDEKIYEYTRCIECKISRSDGEGCNHLESHPEILTGPIRTKEFTYSSPNNAFNFLSPPKAKLKMLRTGALSALFTENRDEATKGILYVLTYYGSATKKAS